MKIITIFLLFITLTLTSCSEKQSITPESYRALDYVILPDYMSCEIPDTDMEITEEDITLSISMELQLMEVTNKKTNNIVETDDIVILTLKYTDDKETVNVYDSEMYYTGMEEYALFDEYLIGRKIGDKFSFNDSLNVIPGYEFDDNNFLKNALIEVEIEDIRVPVYDLTENIAKEYFDGKTVQEVRDLFVTKIQNWRKWDVIEEYLLDNTLFKGTPVQKDIYVENSVEYLKKYAVSIGMSFEEYLTSIDYTEAEYREETEQFYLEMMLYKALAENENLECSDKDYQEKLAELAEGFRMTEEEIIAENGIEYVYYLYRYDTLKELIPQNIN